MRTYKLQHKNFDPVMERRMNERTNIRMYERMDKRKSENYIPPHTSYVGGITMTLIFILLTFLFWMVISIVLHPMVYIVFRLFLLLKHLVKSDALIICFRRLKSDNAVYSWTHQGPTCGFFCSGFNSH